MSALSVVVTADGGRGYWHLVGTGLDAAITTPQAQDSLPVKKCLARMSAVLGESLAQMPRQLTVHVVTVCSIVPLKRRQMKCGLV